MDYVFYEEDARRERIYTEERRAARMRARLARRRRRRVKWFLTKILPFCLVVAALFIGAFFGIRGVVRLLQNQFAKGTVEDVDNEILMADMEVTEIASVVEEESEIGPITEDETEVEAGNEALSVDFAEKSYYADKADSVGKFDDTVLSTNAILVDVNEHSVIANRNGYERISPASMTKVLTLLVAVEHLQDMSGTFNITEDITYYVYKHGLSVVGFGNNEVVTIDDLLYGTILPSGADAALGLATYVAGSEEAFVGLMNEKLVQLGLSDTTHMTNCTGVYDENHYSTCHDIAVIMMAAMDNELCKKVLSEHKYTTSPTDQHSQGIEISNWFLRRIEDKDCGGLVVGAKTGYVKESGHCAVSYATDASGKPYICVTVNAPGNWKCIYDHVRIYGQKFMGESGGRIS